MYSNQKTTQSLIIILLLIQLVIGTPFNISLADEVLQSSEVIQSITPVENTVLLEPITESFPITEAITTSTAPNINTTEESGGVAIDTNTTTTYIENEGGIIPSHVSILSGQTQEHSDITTEIVSENNILLSDQPSLVSYLPQKELIIQNGMIDPLSIDSHNIIDENTDMTFCSYVSYLNLKHITLLPDESFVRGNAIDIWNNLTFQATLSGYAEVVFTGTNLSGQQFIEYLSGIYITSGSSLFDIVTFRPKTQDDQKVELSLMQFHRFVIFLGSDLERYVLDPIRTDSSDPILLTSYLTEHIVDHEEIKIIESYTLTDTVIEDEKESLLTTGDNEDAIVVHSPTEFLPYVLQGLITSPASGTAITNEVIFHTGFRYETVDGSLSALIPAGLVIKTADGKNFNPFTFNINTLSGDDTLSGNYNDNFQFGISGQHLIFSQPIQITAQTPEYIDGVQLDLLVQHEGQDWNKQGLTNNPDAQCISDGSVSQEDQAQTTQVQSGKVIFYTCGASSFALGYVPNTIDLPNANVRTIKIQSDGKRLIGGDFTTVGGIIRNRIARLNSDGSLDTSFDPNVNNIIHTITIQSDGKILIGGDFTTVGGVARNRIARISSTGALDTSFNPNANATLYAITVQSNGQILIGGNFTTVGGVARNSIARISSTGALDTSFNPNANGAVVQIVIQPDENILLGGSFTTLSGTTRNRIARVSSTGLLDTSFDPNLSAAIRSMAIQSDGKILIGGDFITVGGVTRRRIARVSATGALDTSFDPNASTSVYAIVIQPDENILLGGGFTTLSGTTLNRIARVSSTGLIDTTFNPNANNTVNAIALQSDGKIVIGGLFTTVGGITQGYFASLENNTVENLLYNAVPNAYVSTIVTQPDGQILLGGAFTTIDGVTRSRVARVSSTGLLDTTFNPNASTAVFSILLQPNGQVLLGGSFTTVGGTARNRMARVSSTGALDTTFNPNVNSNINGMVLQPNGSIVIGGNFSLVSGVARNRVARVSSTGLLDTTFNPNLNNAVTSVALQTDGQILIGGTFTTIGGITGNSIARISSTGLHDTSFNPNPNNAVNVIALQPDGKILIGGTFTTVGGIARNRIARLNSDGSLDASFDPNLNSTVNSIYVSPNGDIFVGGAFTAAGVLSRNRLVKISSNGTIDPNLDVGILDGTLNAITTDSENNLLIGGTFTNINGKTNNPFFSWIGKENYVDFGTSLFWADAGVGTNCSIDNCAISQWQEKASDLNGTQTTGTNQPVYKSNSINFNPTLQFSGTSTAIGNTGFDYINYGRQSLNIANKMSLFVVQNLKTTGEHYSIGLQQSGTAQRSYSNTKLNSNKGTSTTTTGPIASSYISSLSVDNTIATHYINGSRVTNNTITAGNILSGNNLWVGGTTSAGTFSTNGNIAEIIVYNKTLTGVLRNQIESYLGLKYAISLDQSLDGDGDGVVGTSYRHGTGGIVRDSFINSGYKNNIIGLGSDSMTSLDQRVSKSVSTGDIITIATTEDFVSANQNNERISLDNNAYITMGHDGGSTGMTASYNSGTNNRMSRIRKVASTTMSTGIYIAIPEGMGGMDTSYGIVASADTIFTSTDIKKAFILSGGYLYSDITIPDGYYFTFAQTHKGDVCIEGANTFDLGVHTTQNTSQNIDVLSDYFTVNDKSGNSNGYYTTLSVSNLTGSSGNNISSSTSIQIKARPIDTLSGTVNPSVIVDNAISSYVFADTPVTFIKRDIGASFGIEGTYGSKIDFRIILPPYQKADTYNGTITYTLYEN